MSEPTVTIPLDVARSLQEFVEGARTHPLTDSRENRRRFRYAFGSLVIAIADTERAIAQSMNQETPGREGE